MLKTRTTQKLPQGFVSTGCWVRTISPEKEIKILALREGLPVKALLGHDNQHQLDYTHYSPSTYIRKNMGIRLFAGGPGKGFGVFIRPLTRRIDWWYNGRKEVVSDGIRPTPGKLYDNGGRADWQLHHCSIDDVGQAVLKTHREYAADDYYKENPGEAVTQAWNEGFLRYQRQDITGLLVNPTSRRSVYHALAFKKALQLNVSLYSYHQASGKCQYHPSYDLQKALKINTASESFKALVRSYQRLFITTYKQAQHNRKKSVKNSQQFQARLKA